MRRFLLPCSGVLALIGGCGLVGTYDYDNYEGPPPAESSSSSGTAGMGGMGGTAGMGGMAGMAGMPPVCPPPGGMKTPDLCNNGVDEDCSGGDCVVNAAWSARYGDGLHQQVEALTTTPDGGLALAGRFTGSLNVGAIPLMAPNNNKLYSYVTRLDASRSAVFSKVIEETGQIEAITVQEDATFITGKFPPVVMGNGDVFLRKLNKVGSYAFMDGGWQLEWPSAATISGTAIGTTNFVGAPVFVAGRAEGITAFPSGCAIPPNGVAPLMANKKYGFLMSIAPTDKDCTWGNAIENATIFTLAVNNNTVVIAGIYQAALNGLPMPKPVVANSTGAFIAAYHPATHKVQWANYFVPESPAAMAPFDYVSLLSVAVDDAGNAYALGTFKGDFKIGNSTYTSEANGAGSDMFVIAFDGANGGNVLWFDQFGGADVGMPPMGATQVPYSVVLAKDGLYFSGRTPAGMAIEPGKQSGPICKFTSCAFLMKLDTATGNTIWARDFGDNETATDASFQLAADADSLWLGGGWTAKVDLGTELPPIGAQDVILARFSPLP
ncbi:MAG TPA: hypothetical protein PKA58_29170 [Polyangium sp.]|nr:hypothetical protein [Polyangium sp.]